MPVIHDAPGDDYCDYCARSFFDYLDCQCTSLSIRWDIQYGKENPAEVFFTGSSVPESNHPDQ